jgi:hypothetical protein
MPTAEAPGEATGYELAYHEAVRALTAQDASLSGLRSRCGVVLSAASIVAGFLGPTSAAKGGLALLAAVLFVVGAAAAIFPLFPVAKWRSTTNAIDLITTYVEGDPAASIEETHRSLAFYMEQDWRANEDMLVLRNRVLAIAALFVVAETITWIAAIYGGAPR